MATFKAAFVVRRPVHRYLYPQTQHLQLFLDDMCGVKEPISYTFLYLYSFLCLTSNLEIDIVYILNDR